MKLGSSLRRRRGRERGLRWSLVVAVLAVVIVAVGFGGGYSLATRVIFPSPAPPDDLVEVPNLHGLPDAQAVARIRGLGFALGGVDSVAHPTLPAGSVVGQSPVPGQMALPGDTMTMTVSLGPEQREVPDLLELRSDRALSVLQATGFTVAADSVESELPRGSVVALDPVPGTEVTLPGRVRLTVSLGPAQVAMPLLLGLAQGVAEHRLDSLGLSLAGEDARFGFGVGDGMVIGQDPPPDTLLERGSAVRITVSRAHPVMGTFDAPEP